MGQTKRRRLIGEDGELTETGDTASLSELPTELLYCSRCGAANAPDSNFCRKCGRSLEEQETDMLGVPGRAALGPKAKQDAKQDNKRDNKPDSEAEEAEGYTNLAVVQMMNTLFALGMGITALLTHQGMALIPIAVAWIVVETIRGSRPIHPAMAATHTLTALVIMGLTIAALFTANGMAVIPIMVLWIVLTAARSG